MKKIHNGYESLTNYNCFGCSPHNSIGLQLTFYAENDEVIAKWTPTEDYEGYHNVIHGGIQATLMDEIANWTIINKLKKTGVTKNMQVTYLKSVLISSGEITIRAKVVGTQKNEATISACITDKEGIERATATICYATFPDIVARNKYHFPGAENFFEEED